MIPPLKNIVISMIHKTVRWPNDPERDMP